jgi:hypothetical protein
MAFHVYMFLLVVCFLLSASVALVSLLAPSSTFLCWLL